MIVAIADFLLWLALGLSIIQMAGFAGERRFSSAAATTLFLSISFCFAALIYSFAVSDFSLKIVFENSHTAKPLLYKISGAWGNHEGSLLMLVWVLSLYGFLYTRTKFNAPALAVQGFICLLFIIFMKFTSNPFALLPLVPRNGQGLNPLLQDVGLAIHPPVLYLGYVGFSMVFSIAVGYLLQGKIDKEFVRSLRLWCIIAWSFLTLGIGLGSWWAYRELGWGGFWFWDPVENASLMPWLSGTALVHSIVVMAKRKALKRWTLLLAIITFGLSLTGIFLTRSGVLTSVHTFANDPRRGMMILGIMTVLMSFAFIVYALRAHRLKTHREFEFLSRETGILFNNLLLLVLCATVFLGTIYPLILTSLGGETISVGAPFYEVTFIPIGVIVVYLCATATLGRWRKNRFRELLVRLSAPVGVPKVVAICAYFFFDYSEFEALILFAGLYLLFAVVWEFKHRSAWENVPMIIAHGGVAVLVLGLLLSTAFPRKVETLAAPGSKIHIADFDITLKNVIEGFHNNYAFRRGIFEVAKHEHHIKDLAPEMRVYPVERSSTTEAAIYHHNFVSNLYVIIGERDKAGLYAVRIYYKPFLNLIWLGCLTMFAGGMLRVILQLSRTRALVSSRKNANHRRRDHDDK